MGQRAYIADKETLDKIYDILAGQGTGLADKETLDKIYNILAPDKVYGFIEHMDVLAPEQRIEYTGANKGYAPLMVNKETGEVSYHSWADFPWLKANRPYMVYSDGTPDYQLDENDYALKEDGTASDVANAEYDGGAFAWAMKIYKQEYVAGNDRYVNFSITKRNGFAPVGFLDENGQELEGVWIPMFYGAVTDGKMKCISGTQPCGGIAVKDLKPAVDTFGGRARFFGGPIINTLTDLMILFARTTDLQEAYGSGNSGGYVGNQENLGVKQNTVIGGGRFYGTWDDMHLNKIFHSVVLGSYQQNLSDPYILCMNGRLKVSKNYNYDLTGESYEDAGITYKGGDTQYTKDEARGYPHKFRAVGGFGSFPVQPFRGSTALGSCDQFYADISKVASAYHFGCLSVRQNAGPRNLMFSASVTGGYADNTVGAAILLLPPAGVSA